MGTTPYIPAPDNDLPEPVRQLFARQAERRKSDRNEDPQLRLRFIDSSSPHLQAMSASTLGTALQRLQSLLNWTAWSQAAGPTVDGDAVPASISRLAKTEVVAVSSGSFQITMRRSELDLTDTFDRSIEIIFDLTNLADDLLYDQALEETVSLLGHQACGRAQRFFALLGDNGQHLEMNWGFDRRDVFISAENSKQLSNWLNNYETAVDEIDVVGTLKMADSGGRFRIEDDQGAHYEGRSEADLAGWAIERGCRAKIMMKTRRGRKNLKPIYSLIEIHER